MVASEIILIYIYSVVISNANSYILTRIGYIIKTLCQRKKESAIGYRSTITSGLTLIVFEGGTWAPGSASVWEIQYLAISAVVIRESIRN